jgi:hypothetical protein
MILPSTDELELSFQNKNVGRCVIVRGGASLGATGAKPHFILGDKKKKKEWIFEKQFVHCIFNLLKERR